MKRTSERASGPPATCPSAWTVGSNVVTAEDKSLHERTLEMRAQFHAMRGDPSMLPNGADPSAACAVM